MNKQLICCGKCTNGTLPNIARYSFVDLVQDYERELESERNGTVDRGETIARGEASSVTEIPEETAAEEKRRASRQSPITLTTSEVGRPNTSELQFK